MSTQGFKRGPNSGIAVREFVNLTSTIQKYIDAGFWEDVQVVLKESREEIRDWIRQDHPSPAFGGKDLQTIGHSSKTDSSGLLADLSQFRLGHFGMIGKNGRSRGHADNGAISSLNVYANYFARWYNTGAKQHMTKIATKNDARVQVKNRGELRVKTKEQMSTYYPARGAYFENNATKIGDMFCEIVEGKLQKLTKL